MKDAFTKLQTDFDEIKLAISGNSSHLALLKYWSQRLSHCSTLKSRLEAWQEQVKQKTDIEKQIADIDGEVKRLNAVIDTQVKALAEKQENSNSKKGLG